ncbi:MAG: bifunctional 5,10-methylenetetrahydrofolate dehydrogenase/5,10-methenyltetrahydrofolate cyclohydrolase [Candidatus Kerfeldbacteria bacterium]|nr:bifunctional 5,10-methylenetetrahydrofolate dehydrogenase/5,10-methenyltetrahydrofolate cyclohydrolase [Candidatus Kerfeldbacteria bacterium]
MATIVDGHAIAQHIYRRLAHQVPFLKKRGYTPKLGVILVGRDQASHTYVRKKGEAARRSGLEFLLKTLPASVSTKQLIITIQQLQQPRYHLTGLIVQLPLPKQVNTGKVLEAIDPQLDVDCLTQTNLGKLITGSYWIEPPTPGAILSILKAHHIRLVGQRIVLIGAGALVGRPLANMLFHEQATVTVLNRATVSLARYTKTADIIITGVGQHNLLTGAMLKPGVVVMDAGVSFVAGKMYGDINFASVVKKAKLVTPTPGGVGPLTVAKLIENTVKCARKLSNSSI